jgi:uncharacterized protein with FMN-binding domain
MRRSTAAAVGTLTGAALIIGVRLSVSAPVVTAAPPTVDLGNPGAAPTATASGKPPAKKGKTADPNAEKTQQTADEGGEAASDTSGFKDGVYKGKASEYAYGIVQVSIRVDGGKITAADATYPVTGNSATINPGAIKKLKEETLNVKTAKDVNAVSGATLTSAAYKESLQAAIDGANA